MEGMTMVIVQANRVQSHGAKIFHLWRRSEWASPYSLQVRVQGLDLAGKWGLWRRYAQSQVMGSSTVWGDIRSVWGMEYVWSCRTEIYRQSRSRSRGRWSERVSPYRGGNEQSMWQIVWQMELFRGDGFEGCCYVLPHVLLYYFISASSYLTHVWYTVPTQLLLFFSEQHAASMQPCMVTRGSGTLFMHSHSETVYKQ